MFILWTRLTFYLVGFVALGIGTLAWTAGNHPAQAALKAGVALLVLGVLGWMLNLLVLASNLYPANNQEEREKDGVENDSIEGTSTEVTSAAGDD